MSGSFFSGTIRPLVGKAAVASESLSASSKLNPVDDVSMPIKAHGRTFGNAGPRAIFIDGLRRELEGIDVRQSLSTHLAQGPRKPVDGDGVLINADDLALNAIPLMGNATTVFYSQRRGR
jgi:hypothetical protein